MLPQLTFPFLAFVTVFVVLFWRLPERARGWALTLASAGFILALDRVSFAIVVGSSFGAWALARPSRLVYRGVLIALIGAFAFVKAGHAFGGQGGLPQWLIPIGFGFYVPKVLHLWIESDARAMSRPKLLHVLSYLLFFPTMLVGPIHDFGAFQRDSRRRRWDPERLAEGLRRILYGYAKVVVLANFAVMVVLRGWLFSWAEPETSGRVACECLVYGLNLYLAFAGVSDIAIGVARTLGHDVGENFARPFLQRNISEFWKCWHISLSDWCRRYVFTPVFARWRSYTVAVLLTMLTIGVWHEFTLRYVLWGAYHGAGLAVHRVFARHMGPALASIQHPALILLGKGLSIGATVTFVILGFVLTKNASLEAILDDLRTLLGMSHG
jgi:alginate O-acetyltransferase complex protein AlgI